MKTCCHIFFEMLSSDLPTDCRYLRYLRYIDSKVEKNANDIFIPSITSVFCRSRDRYLDMSKLT